MGDDGSDDEGYVQLMGRLREIAEEEGVVECDLDAELSEDEADSDSD